jgi:hypothetical protein
MGKLLLFFGGFLLIPVLFSEEFGALVRRARGLRRGSLRLQLLVYPLAALVLAAALLLIATSLINFFGASRFAYE